MMKCWLSINHSTPVFIGNFKDTSAMISTIDVVAPLHKVAYAHVYTGDSLPDFDHNDNYWRDSDGCWEFSSDSKYV